ncbi:hypothetical protein G6011_06687 [Alternaria panax]|uniref:Uncharacterized protein n=1 Tax=Alternaria panax TaxID=48097 RepID=A0AAD4FFX9_9PLEO|nr:hypothetical protein G6011_06687 [Alternaria panax]
MLALPFMKEEKRRVLASVQWSIGGATHFDATAQKRFQHLLLQGTPFTQIWGTMEELDKVRGFQVAPAELEVMILECPGVADVAVNGVSGVVDNEEVPRAYVVKKEDEGIMESQVKG